MKKLLLVTAVATLSISAANAAPQIFGKVFVTADYVNAEIDAGANNDYDSNSLQINSNASRIGFKGSEALSANTDVVYQLDYGIRVDGDDRTFKSRDTYLGLANKSYGQFRFGRNTSVIDYVNNVTVNEGFWDNLGSNTLSDGGVVEALNMSSDVRQNNSIVWQAPKYNGLPLEVAVMYSADESFVEDSDDRDNGYGASLMYNPGAGFTAGVAYTKDMDVLGKLLRGTATVDLGKYVAYPVKLGALYQQADFDYSDTKEKGLVVSGELGLNNFAKPASVYLQYNRTDNLDGFDGDDSNQLVLGGKYMLKKNMTAHAYIGKNSADIDGILIDKDNNIVGARRADADVFAVGGGLEYIF